MMLKNMDQSAPDTTANNNSNPPPAPTQTPPAKGDSRSAEKYLGQLIQLINQNKVRVSRTDLNKFSLANIQDHYFISFSEYEVEVSHSKDPNNAKDFYIMLFNNIKRINECPPHKVILAYIHLDEGQFKGFKEAAIGYIERKRKEEEERKFKEAMQPIDEALSGLNSSPADPSFDEPPAEQNPETEDNNYHSFSQT